MDTNATYPLKRRFWQRIAPGLVLFAFLVTLLTVFGARHLAETLYVEAAERRAAVIVKAVSGAAPEGWNAVVKNHRMPGDVDEALYTQLIAEFDHEVEELALSQLKVYSPGGHLLYATGGTPVGKIETGQALRDAVTTLAPQLVDKTTSPTPQYEIYVPVQSEAGDLMVVFELYESADQLNTVLGRVAVPALIPGGLFIFLIIGLAVMVGRAQRHMDTSARHVNELSARLRSFVSMSAVDAAQGSGDDIPSQRVRLTLFYSDARDFTGYSENNPPERVVWFLNELMTIQVNAVRDHGGDVDKMIGDALLARFQGPDAEARALATALAVQKELTAAALPRPVGIGLYTGDVISGAIGSADRRDFTVIGDGVNVCARLCSAAASGEIVVDADTLAAAADQEGFGAEESLTVKGRTEPVRVRRHTSLLAP